MGEDKTVELMGQGKDQVEVAGGQKLRGLFFKPFGLGHCLAFGAVAVKAGVIGRMLKAASVALLEMPSQLFGAADLNGPHHLEVGERQTMRTAVALPVLTKDIRQVGARLAFSCCPPMNERQHRQGPFQSGNLKRSRGLPVETSLCWRICK